MLLIFVYELMPMIKTYFTTPQLILLAGGFFLLLLSIIFFLRSRLRPALILLVAGALSINFFAGISDRYLNTWDERFHVLVAKNMMEHPFKPMLYKDTALSFSYNYWDRYHVWLHKPPLFMWQMALSMKIFGTNELAARLPSILMASLLVLLLYRMGKLLINRQTGYFAALLLCTNFYLVQLVSGQKDLDHNDVAFLFYASASIWAWLEYVFSGKKYLSILTGIFAGFAVLTKWLPGIIVYAIWFTYIVADKKREFRLKHLKEIALSFAICCIVFVPWQVYTFIRFPDAAKMAFEFFHTHVTKPLDGHNGDFLYHINKLGVTYGQFVPYIIIPALLLFWKKCRTLPLKISVLSGLLVVYLFFAISRTKMPTHVFFISSIIFIALASFIDEIGNYLSQSKVPPYLRNSLVFVYMIIAIYSNLNVEGLQAGHTRWNINRVHIDDMTANKELFLRLKKELPANTVLMNVAGHHYIEAMFYTGFPAYYFIPDSMQVVELKSKVRVVAVIQQDSLPSYLVQDTAVRIIKEKVGYGYE
jgi:4-amino-4-deoxy-L-arabinose transferase